MDVDDLLLGMSSQIAEREDNIVVEDLQGLHPLALQLGNRWGTLSLLGLGRGQGGEVRPIATAISTQAHAQPSFNLIKGDAEKLQGTSSMLLGPSWQGHGDDLLIQHGPWQRDKASPAAVAVGVAPPALPCHHHCFESTCRLLVRAPEILPHRLRGQLASARTRLWPAYL